MPRHQWLILFGLSTMVACHRGGAESGTPTVPHDETGERREAAAAEPDDEREYSAPSIRALPRRPIVGPPPRVRIVRPKNQAFIAGGPVTTKLQVTGWKLAPAPGNHVHVKVDGSKEFAIRDASKPFALDERYEQETGEPLGEGTHVLRVFLSRPNHESVKVPSAFDVVVFHYRSRSRSGAPDLDKPMLTYSRPQGCASDPDRLLDFVVTNVNGLSKKGYRVQYVIDSVHTGTLFSWSPYQIGDLRQGNHTLRLTLLRPDNKPAPGPFNDVTTMFEVSESCRFLGLIPEDAYGEDEEVLE